MQKLRIALISDLHVGLENRGMDMCPHQLPPDEVNGRNKDYIGSIVRQAKEFLERGAIDMLCITGDISNRAHSEEFKSADNAIKRITNALNISDGQIYFVPGNHDIHWTVMELKPSDFWRGYRYMPLLQNGLVFERCVAARRFGAIDRAPFFIAWDAEKAVVVGINSAAFDGPEEKLHTGMINEETVQTLDIYLSSLPNNLGKARICLLHHHPIQYSEKIPESPDLSIAVNSEHLLNVLNKHSFDLVLHGHKHQPRLKTHLNNNCHPFVSFCAGSFSSILHPLYFEGISNLFHILNVDGRDETSKGIQGTVQSWTHVADGTWKVSHENRGIPAVEAFGSLATPSQVKSDLLRSIPVQMESSPVCKWDDLIKLHPNLQFVNSTIVHNVMKEVTGELGYDMVGDRDSCRDQWLIFRRKT